MLCCAMLCCAVLCCAVPCCAVLCCAVLCHAVLCCAGNGLLLTWDIADMPAQQCERFAPDDGRGPAFTSELEEDDSGWVGVSGSAAAL